MKKSKKTALIAASFAVAMGLSGCFNDEDPNISVRSKEPTTSVEETNNVVTEYGVEPGYDETEEVYDVYGPPIADDDDDDGPYAVYGPPPSETSEETEG